MQSTNKSIPIRTAFVITSMPVGGAETLLVNLMARLDSSRFAPEVVCLKERGPLGEQISGDFPVTPGFLKSKYDLRVLPRLVSHFRRRNIGAVITVGAGDKMFWGRLAARIANVPVIASALHSTGWPDGVGKMNRWLTQWTDAFIAVAKPHGQFLIDFERFPASKVSVIPNGIDTQRFVPASEMRSEVRRELKLTDDASLVGIVAALRHEKNHAMFVDVGARIAAQNPKAHFVIVGDGVERNIIEERIRQSGFADRFHLLGTRSDTPKLLAAFDAFALTSHNEANPVSILEALSCQVPVVATDVGSVSESVQEGITGNLIEPGNVDQMADRLLAILADADLRRRLGENGRSYVVQNGSVDAMVRGYEELISRIYEKKTTSRSAIRTSPTCQQMLSRPFF